MCGISGIAIWRAGSLATSTADQALSELFRLSQRRGKEASGIAVRTPKRLATLRMPLQASRMVRRPEFRDLLGQAYDDVATDGRLGSGFATIGHARLVTNGRFGIAHNNQPIVSDGVAVVHNGIILNDSALFASLGTRRRTELDTEAISALLAHHLAEGASVPEAARRVYAAVEGEANIAALFADRDELLLATNVGSLYCLRGDGYLLYASEKPILADLLRRCAGLRAQSSDHELLHLRPGQGLLVDLAGAGPAELRLESSGAVPAQSVRVASPVPLQDPTADAERRRLNLSRCTRCILPETMPGISFDANGVCSYCLRHKLNPLKGRDALAAIADRHRSKDGSPDCIIGLSGGRDSSYGLHYLRKELGLNPIAYTYDWALVTDIARRNASLLCAKLAVEHVLVSADIQSKRRNIRANVEAWAARPDLGMVPLFMAGDKAYFYHYGEVSRRYGIDLVFTCGNRFEMTDFKSGFAGVRTDMSGDQYRPYNVTALRKAKLVGYYASNFLRNPRYLNRSIFDTAKGFYYSYVMKHDLVRIFDYVPWDEAVIDVVLRDQYGWEEASDTDSTWRIGDGTAAFYNYIYYSIAGFTEHDTFRSNQIRAGVISREEALAAVTRDNQPRFNAMREYADTIGFEFDRVLAAIDMAPKLY